MFEEARVLLTRNAHIASKRWGEGRMADMDGTLLNQRHYANLIKETN